MYPKYSKTTLCKSLLNSYYANLDMHSAFWKNPSSAHTGSKNRRLKIISFPPEFEMKFHIYFALLLSKNFCCCCLNIIRGRIWLVKRFTPCGQLTNQRCPLKQAESCWTFHNVLQRWRQQTTKRKAKFENIFQLCSK